MLGVDSSRPPCPTTKLNVDAVAQFREFRCGDRRWQCRWWLVLSTGVLCGRRVISVSVIASGILLVLVIIIVHGGQVLSEH